MKNELTEIFAVDGEIPEMPDLVEGVDYFPEEGATYQSLGGKVSNEIRKQKGQMMFDPEWQKKYNGAYSPNNCFKDPEFRKRVQWRGGGKLTAEAKSLGGKASTAIKYKCKDCDMISSIGGITTHIKYSKHIGYERLVNGNKTR